MNPWPSSDDLAQLHTEGVTMLRRSLLRSVALIAPIFTAPSSLVFAQATPAVSVQASVNPFAHLNLPEVAVTVTDHAIEGLPSRLTAGRFVLSVTNATTAHRDGVLTGVDFLRVPTGMTTASLLQSITASAAMPVMMDEQPASWMADTTITGGPYAGNDRTAYAIVDLTAGSWILWTEDPNAAQAAVSVVVTGEAMPHPPSPVSNVRVEMAEFSYTFSNAIAAGSLIIEVANVGTQPHFIGLIRVPSGTTVADVQALVAGEAEGFATPTGNLTGADLKQVFAAGDQSAGVRAWYATDLSAGTYAAACFMSDSKDGGALTMLGQQGASHTMLGMVAIIEVM